MIALDDTKVNYEHLLKYPIQVPRIKVISNIVSGALDLHFSHKKIIFSDSTENTEGELRELLTQTKAKCRAYKLYFHSIKWICVTNLYDEGRGSRNYATLYLYDYSVIYFEALHLLPLLERLWSSQLLLEVRGVKRLEESPKRDALKYFQCVVDDLQVNHASSFSDVFQILDEFAGEVALDLTLKNLCFERTEIFTLCLSLIRELRQLEPREFSFTPDRIFRLVFPADLARKVRTQTVQSEETQQKLMMLATKRVERIIAIFETVCAIFYASDTCSPNLRKSVLLRDSPLGLSIWVPLLATDLAMDQLILLGCIAPPNATNTANNTANNITNTSPNKTPNNNNRNSSNNSNSLASSVDLESNRAEWMVPPLEDEAFDRARQRCRSLQLLLLHQLDGISEMTRALAGNSHLKNSTPGAANTNNNSNSNSSSTNSGSGGPTDAGVSFSGSSNASSTVGGLFPPANFVRRPRLGNRAGFLGLSTISRKLAMNSVAPESSGSNNNNNNGGVQLTMQLKGGGQAAAEALQWSCVAEALCGGSLVSADVWESALEALLNLVMQSLDSLCRRLKMRDQMSARSVHNNSNNTNIVGSSVANVNYEKEEEEEEEEEEAVEELLQFDVLTAREEGFGEGRRRLPSVEEEEGLVADKRYMKPSLVVKKLKLQPPKPSLTEPSLSFSRQKSSPRILLADSEGRERSSSHGQLRLQRQSSANRSRLTVLISDHHSSSSSRLLDDEGLRSSRSSSRSLRLPSSVPLLPGITAASTASNNNNNNNNSNNNNSNLVLATAKRWEERLLAAMSEEGVVEEAIMLFVASSLLRSLSADSASVRDMLHMHEHAGSSSALRAALGMLQTLAPRVNQPALVALEQPDSDYSDFAPPAQHYSPNHNPLTQSQRDSNNIRSSNKPNDHVSPTHASWSLSQRVSGANPFASASSFSSPSAKPTPAHNNQQKKNQNSKLFVCQACVIDEFTPSSALATAEAEAEAFLSPYEERWQLLVTSRLNLEDAVRLAMLPLPASFTAVRPIADMF